jgi:hypothetical protein
MPYLLVHQPDHTRGSVFSNTYSRKLAKSAAANWRPPTVPVIDE